MLYTITEALLGLSSHRLYGGSSFGGRPPGFAPALGTLNSVVLEERPGTQGFLTGAHAWVDALLLLTALLLFVGLLYHIYSRWRDTRRALEHDLEWRDTRRALERDLERRRFLENVLLSLAHPFYVIDAETYEVLMANEAAKASVTNGTATCYRLTHGRDTPCDGDDRECPLEIVRKTRAQATTEHRHIMGDGEERIFEVHGFPVFDGEGKLIQMIEYALDITDRKVVEREREELIRQLEKALGEVKTLSGMLPICSSCKKVRDDRGYWNQIEQYISQRSEAHFSHSLCPDCAEQLYPGLAERPKNQE
jgi:PAS domain-containing protein